MSNNNGQVGSTYGGGGSGGHNRQTPGILESGSKYAKTGGAGAAGYVYITEMLIVPTFSFATTFCFGADGLQLPTTSDNGVPGTWKLNNQTVTTINTEMTGENSYVFVPTPSEYGNYTLPVTVTILPEIIISGTITNVNCYGESTGAIDVTVTGGTPSYSYMWNTQSTNEDLTQKAAGTYTLMVTDNHALHCTASKDFTISQPQAALSVSITGTNVKCYGEATGAADLTVTGGTSPYTYEWDNNATSQDLNGVLAGIYRVIVTDDKGCKTDAEVTITEPQAALTITEVSSTPVSCHANQGVTNDGTITITATGGTITNNSGYKYSTLDNPDYYGNSNVISGLSAGTCTVYVMDANGCKANANATVAEPTANAIAFNNPQTTAASCNPDNEGTVTDGKIAITATGGTGTLTYMLYKGDVEMPNNPWINGEFQNLIAGTYHVLATDENGCSFYQNNITVGSPDAVTITGKSATNVSCAANNMGNHTDGTVTLTATGGSGSYTYSANGSSYQNSNVLTGLGVTEKQYVYVKDDKGCVAKDSVAIGENPYMEATVTATPATCNGGKGSVKATATGGTPDYTYAWNNQATTQEVPNLTAGQYTVTVTDANGCQYVADGTIDQPQKLQLTTGNPKAVSCNGGNDGKIPFTVSGGTAPYTLACGNNAPMILDAAGDSLVKDLTAGTYDLTLVDANQCEATVTGVSVNQPSALVATLDNPTHVRCHGGHDGVLPVNVSGGVAPYTIAWGGPNDIYVMQNAGNYSIANLSAGTYTVTVTDKNGCSKTLDPQEITEPQASIAISNFEVVNVSCNAANGGLHSDGSITVTVTGNSGAVSYSRNGVNFSADNVIGGLSAGKYGITVKDENGCSAIDSVVVSEPDAMTIDNVTLTSPKCVNGTDGSIEVTSVTNNQGNTLEYAINDGTPQQDSKFDDLSAGQYIITATDGKNCVASYTAELQQAAAMTISATGNNVSCHSSNEGEHANGSISVVVTNGTAPYQYSKDGQTYGDSVSTITNLAVGTYNIYVKDANGCTASKNSIAVNQPAAFTMTSATPTNVTTFGGNDGQITIVADGAVKYYLADVEKTNPITGLEAGTYTVFAENANGCKASKQVTVGQPGEITMTVDSTNLTCKGNQSGTITINAQGGVEPLSYSIDGTNYRADNSFSGLQAGTYTASVKDANGAVKSKTVNLTEPDAVLTLTAGTTTKVTCANGENGSVEMTVAGGTAPYTLAYNGRSMGVNAGANLVEDLSANNYTMTLTDANNCTATADVTIEEITTLTIANGNPMPVKCHGDATGRIDITVANGTAPYTVAWGGNENITMTAAGDTAVKDLAAGTYTVKVTDANGCTAETSALTITEPSQLSMMTGVVGNIACHGEANGFVPVIVNDGTAPYTVTADDGTNPATSITMTAAGRDTVKNLKAGNYTITVKDANDCEVSATATITEPDTLKITAVDITAPSCNAANATTESGLLNNGKIVVTATGGTGAITYSIDGTNYQASNVLNTLTAGTYTVYVKDANGCPAQMDNVEIVAPVAMTASVINVVNVKCKGDLTGSAEVTVENGKSPYTYSWNSNPEQHTAVASTLKAGDYTVVVTDDLGCTVTATQTIEEPANAMSADIASTNVKCYGESTGTITVSNVANAAGTVAYAWTNPITSTTAEATGVPAGTYSVTLTDENGCKLIKTATVEQPGAALTVDVVVPTGNALNSCTQTVVANVNGGTGTITYSWSGDASGTDATAIVTGTGAHTVTVTVTDGNTCSATGNGSYTATQPAVVMTTCGANTIPAAADVIAAVNDALAGCATVSSTATVEAAGVNFINDTTINVVDGSNTYSVQVKKNMPNVTIQASTTEVCAGESVTLTATQIAGATYAWTPNVGTDNEVVVTPTATTTYKVVVTSGTCSKQAPPQTITFKPVPAINDVTKELCTGEALWISATSTPGHIEYTWTVKSNTGVTGAIDHTSPVSPTYLPILEFSYLTNTTTASQTVVYEVHPSNGGCDGDAFTVTATVKPSIVNDNALVFNAPTIEHTLYYGACDTLVNIVTPDFSTSIAEYDGLLTLTNNRSTSNSGAILGRVAPGDNTIIWTLTDPCGNTRTFTQHIIVKYPECGTATDADGNVYQSVRIGCECWTTTNLKSTTYASNLGGGEIPEANAYTCNEYPDENANIDNFGLLYSWYSAMKVPEGDDNTAPATQTAPNSGYQYVQGVCPNGWALPTDEQYQNMANSVANFSDVKSDDASKWLPGAQGTNGSGFGAVASGYYDPTTGQYYNLLGDAYYWSSAPTTTVTKGKCSHITHTCPMLINTEQDKGMGLSVRCVQRAQ